MGLGRLHFHPFLTILILGLSRPRLLREGGRGLVTHLGTRDKTRATISLTVWSLHSEGPASE